MRKFFTLFAALMAAVALNAATVTWSAEQIKSLGNNYALDGESFDINDCLTISFANAEASENNYVRLRTVSTLPAPVVAFYSKNSMTVSATGATINSIQFDIFTEGETSDATPGWKVTADGQTLEGDDDTWTGSASSVTFTGGSKTSITSITIDYTPAALNPGEEVTYNWLASSLNGVANNDVLDGRTFDINNYLSFSLDNNGGDKDIIFKKTSSAPTTINLYSKNAITFTAAEGVTITAIQFVVNTSEGTSNTPGWNLQDEAKNSYTADADTWTGNATSITFTDKSAAQLLGVNITYKTAGDDNGEGGDDNGDDNGEEGEFQSASLFFTADLVGQGEIAQNVTLSDNGTSVVFTSNSANAQIDDNTFNYGTAEEYDAIQYRYRPGGKSSNGVNSTNKGVFTFPCAGTLYLYVFNNQEGDPRSLELIQNDETIFNHAYASDEYVNIGDEENVVKVWPVLTTEVAKGTATLLWPVNQVMISGFEFVPAEGSGDNNGDNNDDNNGVDSVETVINDGRAYDLQGRPVSEDYRGIVILNGKKYIKF